MLPCRHLFPNHFVWQDMKAGSPLDPRTYISDVFDFTASQQAYAKACDIYYEKHQVCCALAHASTDDCCKQLTKHQFLTEHEDKSQDVFNICTTAIAEECELFLGFDPEKANYAALASDLNAVGSILCNAACLPLTV